MYLYICTGIHTYIHTYIQTDRQTDMHTEILHILVQLTCKSRSGSWTTYRHCGTRRPRSCRCLCWRRLCPRRMCPSPPEGPCTGPSTSPPTSRRRYGDVCVCRCRWIDVCRYRCLSIHRSICRSAYLSIYPVMIYVMYIYIYAYHVKICKDLNIHIGGPQPRAVLRPDAHALGPGNVGMCPQP